MKGNSWDRISQVAIFVFGLTGILLVSFDNKWGFACGLASQPFWFITSYVHKQKGVFLVSIGYTISWAVGFFRHFFV